MRCNRNKLGSWESHLPEIVVEFTKFAFKGGRSNKYCADDGDDVVRCNRSKRKSWEVFTVKILKGQVNSGGPRKNDKLEVSIQGGRNNKFCCDDRDATMRCNRGSVQSWEKFTLAFV